MHVFNTQEDLINHIESSKKNNSTIGFVPTMGALHDGHLSLLKESLENNDLTVISIFVNPTQFNNLEDLEKYPRTIDADLEKIKSLNSNIIVYTPTVKDIYDNEIKADKFDFDGLENQMEGKSRPGHFDGVGTIVSKLFKIVNPTNAYFGEKDFQQLQIIKKMVEKNNLPINIIGCPILREPSGLAMSSRNARLTEAQKDQAKLIYQTLLKAKELFSTTSINETIKWVEDEFNKHPDFTLEYFTITNQDTLKPETEKTDNIKYRGFIVVHLNNVRLIDTILLN